MSLKVMGSFKKVKVIKGRGRIKGRRVVKGRGHIKGSRVVKEGWRLRIGWGRGRVWARIGISLLLMRQQIAPRYVC